MKSLKLKSSLETLVGVKRYTAAFILGAVMTLAMPPVGAVFVLLVCIPGFVWLLKSCQKKRQAILTGWAFGAGYFIFGLYWISMALFVDIDQFWWVLPFSAL